MRLLYICKDLVSSYALSYIVSLLPNYKNTHIYYLCFMNEEM